MAFSHLTHEQLPYQVDASNWQLSEEALKKQTKRDTHLSLSETADHYYDQGNFSKAMEWYNLAALEGDGQSQNLIGQMYQQGRGVPQDYALAMIWYLKAHSSGIVAAANNIGFLYCEGLGVTQDYQMGLKWYLVAAYQGFAIAQSNVGGHYENGLGVKVDKQYALEWYERGSNQGHFGAKYAIQRLNNEGFHLNNQQKKYIRNQQVIKIQKEETGLLKDKLKLAEQELTEAEKEKNDIVVKINSLNEEIRVLTIKNHKDKKEQLKEKVE